MERELLRVNEVAQILGLGRTTTYELIRTRVIPSIRLGKTLRVPEKALREYIEKNTCRT